MPINEIHVADIGTIMEATILDENEDVVDISGATTKNFLVKKPDDTTTTWTGTFTTDGTDGKFRFASIAGTFDQEGEWSLQGRIVLPAWDGRTDWYDFLVHPNVDG